VARVDPTQSPERELELTDEFIEMQNYLHGHLERYRQHPAENLLSAIANAQSDGEKLTFAEAVSIAHQLMVAGNETTTTVMLACLHEIMTRPGLRAKVLADFGILPGIIEETLRMHTPVPMFYRTVAEETELGGIAISRGSMVCLGYLGGNYDPDKWETPDSFQPGRPGVKQHLAFGRGAHYCIGHLVAKAELRIALELLLTRLTNLRLSDRHAPPAFVPHPFIHSLGPMYLQFDV
jgi:cytochrome P450